MKTTPPNDLARALRPFFFDHLPAIKGVSIHTIRSYRDTFTLFLRHLALVRKREATQLDFEDLIPEAVIDFLAHLEKDRHNAVSTRNVRLAAIHAFFRYVAANHPDRLEHSQRILGLPFKRTRHPVVEYLEYDELEAVFSAADRATASGRRDYALLVTLFNTGARVQELLDLRGQDLQLSKPFQVRLFGKGRKERICPLWPQTAAVLRAFCAERHIDSRSPAPLFVNQRGEQLTRFGVRYILRKYLALATRQKPRLNKKNLHPHSMRHSTAVHLLKAGIDMTTIKAWLGHASTTTTNRYATIDLSMKRDAIARAKPVRGARRKPAPWRKDTSLLAWLEAL